MNIHSRKAYWGHVNPIGPRACYDEGKRCTETLFFDYHRQHGVAIKVARIFNTYGPLMQRDDGRVVSNFIVRALHGAPLTIYGKGTQTRSLCYVDDLVEGLVLLMASPSALTGPVNLGNPNVLTIAAIAERVLALTQSQSIVSYSPLPVDDPRKRRPDSTKATTELGWVPKVDVEDGLQRTIEYFRLALAAS